MEDKNNMLVECSVCGESISKNAKSCPYCGEPYNVSDRGRIGVILIHFLIMMILVIYGLCMDDTIFVLISIFTVWIECGLLMSIINAIRGE